MWFSKKSNAGINRVRRRRETRKRAVFTLHAKASGRNRDSMHKAGTVALVAIAVGGAVWLVALGVKHLRESLFAGNEHFVLRTIETTSSGRLTAAHLREYGGFSEGANLFDLDIAAIKKRLEDVPLIRDVTIQRRLPSTLVVRVNERVPVARIAPGTGGFFFSVDRDSMVIGLAGSQLMHLPVVKGFRDRGISPGTSLSDTGASDALQLLTLLDESPAGDNIRLTTIDVSNPDYLDLSLESGIKVLLPRQVSRAKLEDLRLILREAGNKYKFFDLTLERNIPAS